MAFASAERDSRLSSMAASRESTTGGRFHGPLASARDASSASADPGSGHPLAGRVRGSLGRSSSGFSRSDARMSGGVPLRSSESVPRAMRAARSRPVCVPACGSPRAADERSDRAPDGAVCGVGSASGSIHHPSASYRSTGPPRCCPEARARDVSTGRERMASSPAESSAAVNRTRLGAADPYGSFDAMPTVGAGPRSPASSAEAAPLSALFSATPRRDSAPRPDSLPRRPNNGVTGARCSPPPFAVSSIMDVDNHARVLWSEMCSEPPLPYADFSAGAGAACGAAWSFGWPIPSFSRILRSISAATSAFLMRKLRAFSLP